jgi:hypothetical protein
MALGTRRAYIQLGEMNPAGEPSLATQAPGETAAEE